MRVSPTKLTAWSTKQLPSAQHVLTVSVSPAPPLSAGKGLYTSASKGREAQNAQLYWLVAKQASAMKLHGVHVLRQQPVQHGGWRHFCNWPAPQAGPCATSRLRRAPHIPCTLRHTLHATLRHRSHAPKPLARGQAQGQVVVAHGGSHVDPELNGGVEGRGHACPVSLPVGRLGRASGQRSPISLNARLRFCRPLPSVR